MTTQDLFGKVSGKTWRWLKLQVPQVFQVKVGSLFKLEVSSYTALCE